MTTFNPDPRVRDLEPNTTALGPNFPGSLGDLQRMQYRPSTAFLRYVALAVVNDDGSKVTAEIETLLKSILAEQEKQTALLQALLDETQRAGSA